MKSTRIIIAFLSMLFITSCGKKTESGHNDHNQSAGTEPQADTIKKSIPREEHAQIGDAHAMIKYHAPTVRGRTIWGGLVPYGEVWVTGAHSATSFEIDKDFVVNDQEIPAGKYALFTIPDKESWTIIINKNWEQHLADDYDQKDDILRVTVNPEYTNENQERLKYTLVPSANSDGMVQIRWEKVAVELPFKVK